MFIRNFIIFCLCLNSTLYANLEELEPKVRETLSNVPGLLDVKFSKEETKLHIHTLWTDEGSVYDFSRSKEHDSFKELFRIEESNINDRMTFSRDFLLTKYYRGKPQVLVTNTFDLETETFSLSIKAAESEDVLRKRAKEFDQQLENQYMSKTNPYHDALANALFGAGLGTTGAVTLIIKDAIFGVVIPGGPAFYGWERVLPCFCLVGFTSGLSAALGYMYEVNLLD